ncbi:MAG: winged helix-turn-helix transcriptional regulator [Candidatus Asgardarchaeia archaeon]
MSERNIHQVNKRNIQDMNKRDILVTMVRNIIHMMNITILNDDDLLGAFIQLMNKTTLRVLKILDEKGAISEKILTEKYGISQPTAHRVLEKLRRLGIVFTKAYGNPYGRDFTLYILSDADPEKAVKVSQEHIKLVGRLRAQKFTNIHNVNNIQQVNNIQDMNKRNIQEMNNIQTMNINETNINDVNKSQVNNSPETKKPLTKEEAKEIVREAIRDFIRRYFRYANNYRHISKWVIDDNKVKEIRRGIINLREAKLYSSILKTDEIREIFDEEIEQLKEEIDRVANSMNGKKS